MSRLVGGKSSHLTASAQWALARSERNSQKPFYNFQMTHTGKGYPDTMRTDFVEKIKCKPLNRLPNGEA
ncbi:MAG: hypothetical protein NVS3B11_05900 [Collimonas sp.]